MSNGPAAQPSLPHDELEAGRTKLGRILDRHAAAVTAGLRRGTHPAVVRWNKGEYVLQIEALILAQRQEAVKEFSKVLKSPDTMVSIWSHKEGKKVGEGAVTFATIDAALQTYLEGEK